MSNMNPSNVNDIKSPNRAPAGCITAILGVVIANVVVVSVVFALAAIYGYSVPMIGHPNGGSQVHPVKYGIEGGVSAVGIFAIVSVLSFGLIPAGVSIAGGLIALVVRWMLIRKSLPSK